MQPIKVKNKDLLIIYKSIEAILKSNIQESDEKFIYSLSKTKRSIKDDVESYNETSMTLLENYMREGKKLVIEYAKKNEKGNPIVEKSKYILDDEYMHEYLSKKELLDERYKETFDKVKSIDNLEVTVLVSMIDRNTIPKTINHELLSSIIDIVKGE